MPKMKLRNNYLERRSDTRFWQFKRRIPEDLQERLGKTLERQSLKTANVDEARKMRDTLVRQQDQRWASLRRQQALLGERAALPTDDAAIIEKGNEERLDPDYQPVFDEITDALDALVGAELEADPRLSQEEAFDWVTENTKAGVDLYRELRLWRGELTWIEIGENHLKAHPKPPGTAQEYRRAYKKASAALPPPGSLSDDPQAKVRVQRWTNALGTDEGLAEATIKKMVGALRMALKTHGTEPTFLTGLSIPTVKQRTERQPWSDAEISLLMSNCEYDWLRRAIIIAAHTGARQEAVAELQYLPAEDWIRFPKMKRETENRLIACPDRIRETVRQWVANPRTKSSISNRFTELKQSLGFTDNNVKVFHGFRRTALSRLTNKHGVELMHAKLIAGHKIGDEILRAYYSDYSPENLRDYANRLEYPTLEAWYD
ncbi:hypothetical protein HK107_02060 [Parvularcula sp. ZS-1/3]|uniref:DUF6538 domain-containing protein n=1 Tax=Parvularcula mediterranea TaxID=2732508 RepID=A0A7Y3RJB2_9PROT|nr:DUF6538 domain-containing protein [Parvularcula mediterranea]NNU15108.1 hypothetical protein [Parvularcula mediterranea]